MTLSVPIPFSRYKVTRMSPYNPAEDGRTLTAPEVRIDGRAVAADGSWPGFSPTAAETGRDGLSITLGAGEAAVLTFTAST